MASFMIQLSKSLFVIIAKSKPSCVRLECEPCPSYVFSFLEPSSFFVCFDKPSVEHPRLIVPLVSVPPLDHQACSDSWVLSWESFQSTGVPSLVSSVPKVPRLSSDRQQGRPLRPGNGPCSRARTMEKRSGLCQNMVTFFWLNPLKKDNIVIFSNDCLSWITSALV